MAGLRVRQAFGVFLLLGLGVGSSSPQVLRHPTSMCNSGFNYTGTMDLNTKEIIHLIKKFNNNSYLYLLKIMSPYAMLCHTLR